MRKTLLAVIAVAVVAAAAVGYTLVEMSRSSPSLPAVVAGVLQGKEAAIRVTVVGATGGRVPVAYTCDARHPRPPHVEWSSVPGAKAYILVVLDPDAPTGTFIHLVAYDGTEPRWPAPGYKLGLNSAGRPGWFPVCPPAGDKPHHYYFIVIALDRPTGLPGGASLNQVLEAAYDHIIAYGYTVLTYARR